VRRLATLVLLSVAVPCCAQSLGDAARENRRQPKQQRATKVFTNDELKAEGGAPDGATQEVDRVRSVFRGICDDPRTDHGRKLSDYDRDKIENAARPVRARANEYEATQRRYKTALADLDKEMETEIAKAWPAGRRYSQADSDRIQSLRQEYGSRRMLLVAQAEGDLRGYEELKKQRDAAWAECPGASRSVPTMGW
jgi:hypothetical protein